MNTLPSVYIIRLGASTVFMEPDHWFDIAFRQPARGQSDWIQAILWKEKMIFTCLLNYAKVSDHEHSKVLKSSHSQFLPNKVKIIF